MSMAKLNPLRDEEWSTSSHRAPSTSRQLQTRGHQQDRRQPPHNPQQRTTTTVMRQTTVRQLHRQPFGINGNNSNSQSSISGYSSNHNGGNSSSSRQLGRQQPHFPHPRGDSALHLSHRPPPYSSQSSHSRQPRDGIASSSDPRFTAQDWKNWIKTQGDNNRRPAPRTIITTKSAQLSKDRPPATQVAQLAIKSAPPSASSAPLPSSNKTNGRTQLAGVVEAMQDIAALTVAAPSKTATGARSPPSSTSSSGQGTANLISVTSKPAVEDSSIVVEDLLALGPAATDSPSVAKERLPEVMADLIDLDFSITFASKHSHDAVDNMPEVKDTEDLGVLLKAQDDLDHPWKQVKEDRIELTSQEDHEVQLIDFSDDVHTSVPVTAVQSDHSLASTPIAAVQKDDSPPRAPLTAVQNDDLLAVSTATAVHQSNDPLTGPAITIVQSERSERGSYAGSDYTDSDLDSDSDTDSDGSEDGHEDPWTILDNGRILVKLKSLEEMKSELNRACYAWEDVLARIKI
ncbi:hypothetical protein EC968_004260 [Mortierella alpina]|nr:hypothetical protein EC968_004260 [Mortierella alpina]